MKKNAVFATIATLCLFLLSSGITGGCKTAISKQPVKIVSLSNVQEINTPGGPTINMTLKNTSSDSIVYLTAFCTPSATPPIDPFVFTFKIDPSNSLMPGTTISQTQILIGGGFNKQDTYPVGVQGIFQNGRTFTYEEYVRVT